MAGNRPLQAFNFLRYLSKGTAQSPMKINDPHYLLNYDVSLLHFHSSPLFRVVDLDYCYHRKPCPLT